VADDADARRDVERRLDELLAQQADLVARLESGQRYFQQLARSVWRVQEDERRRLARELHDGIGQNLTAIVHLVSQAAAALPPGADGARATLEKIHGLATTTIDDTRALSRLLRPQILDDLGLEAALRWLARTFGEGHALDVRLALPQPFPQLDGDRSTLIFRVAQEALTNVVRHAQARRVDIAVQCGAAGLRMQIRDDGRGCDAAAAVAAGREGRASGVGGMRDRVRLFNGRFALQSQPGRGVALTIDVPLAGDAGDAR